METLDGVSLAKIANSNQLSQFLHECVDVIIGRKQSSDSDRFSTTSDIAWTSQEFHAARILIENLYKSNAFKSEFEINLHGLASMDKQQIKDCFEIRKSEIQETVIKDSLLKSELPLVENMDWKLKWVLGSSKLANICTPLLQLNLHCVQNELHKTVQKTINCEMDLDQLDTFINELESAKYSFNK